MRRVSETACAWLGSLGGRDVPDDSPFPPERLRDAARRVFSRDADGIGPFLDPRHRVSHKHLTTVAKRAGLSEDQIEPLVEQINRALGWDIRLGLAE